MQKSDRQIVMNEHVRVARRAFSGSKAHQAWFEATPRLRRLALVGTSIRRKRHESVMSIVMDHGLDENSGIVV